MQIKLSFQIFNANQLFSPVAGEYKQSKERLKRLIQILIPQLQKYNRYPSKNLPANIKITYIINKNNFDFLSLFLLTHSILSTLGLSTTLQDTNNLCISQVTIAHKYTDNITHEGCIIDITD